MNTMEKVQLMLDFPEDHIKEADPQAVAEEIREVLYRLGIYPYKELKSQIPIDQWPVVEKELSLRGLI